MDSETENKYVMLDEYQQHQLEQILDKLQQLLNNQSQLEQLKPKDYVIEESPDSSNVVDTNVDTKKDEKVSPFSILFLIVAVILLPVIALVLFNGS